MWEEDEVWINLSWAIDPDGAMGIRQWFESPYRAGQKLTVDEYYGWMFENSVPGLPEAAAKEGLKPLEYMRKYGAYEVTTDVYKLNEKPVAPADLSGSAVEANGVVTKAGKAVGVMVDEKAVVGVCAAGILSQPHSSRGAGGVDRRASHRFRCTIRAAGGVAQRCQGRCLYTAADLSLAASDSHAFGKLEVSIRDGAQESAVVESYRCREARQHRHRRSAESSH